MNNYLIFIEEMYLRGIISKETYEKSKKKGRRHDDIIIIIYFF